MKEHSASSKNQPNPKMHLRSLALLALSLATSVSALALPVADPEPADPALASDIDSALDSFESSLQLIENLNGLDGCDVKSCIADMAPAITECSQAQEANFSNPQQDVACLGSMINAAEGFVSTSFFWCQGVVVRR